MLFWRSVSIWLLLVLAAIINGVVRDQLLAPALGAGLALPVSGVTLTLLIFLIVFHTVGFLGRLSGAGYWWVGGLWVLLTLVFEFGLGYFVAAKSTAEIMAVFDLPHGNLFILALLACGLAPWAAAKVRGL